VRVYKIEYCEYEYQCGVLGGSGCRSDYVLSHTMQKHVMADQRA
jgi:hypothetical protein